MTASFEKWRCSSFAIRLRDGRGGEANCCRRALTVDFRVLSAFVADAPDGEDEEEEEEAVDEVHGHDPRRHINLGERAQDLSSWGEETESKELVASSQGVVAAD